MTKRLSANAPKPRTRFPFPGYPTVAAAGLYLCLSSGCAPQSGVTSPGSNTGTETTTDIQNTGAAPIPYPPETPPTGIPDASPPNNMEAGLPRVMIPPADGFGPESFEDDAGVPDAEPPPVTAPDASEPDAEPTLPNPAGDIAPPY